MAGTTVWQWQSFYLSEVVVIFCLKGCGVFVFGSIPYWWQLLDYYQDSLCQIAAAKSKTDNIYGFSVPAGIFSEREEILKTGGEY